MGNSHSQVARHPDGGRFNSTNEKHNSADSQAPLQPTCTLTSETPPSPAQIDIDPLAGHSNITRPPPPPRLRHLSELIDPEDLAMDAHIRSPSGNLLAPEQFLVHPDRPRSIRERQEKIRERVRMASQLGVHGSDGLSGSKVSANRDSSTETGQMANGAKRGYWRCGCFSSR